MNLVLCLTEQCNLRCSYCYYKDTQSARHNVMDDETLDEYLATVSFPLALKPREGRGSVGFKKVNNREELDKLIAEGTVKVEEYVIQEFIDEVNARVAEMTKDF